MPKRVSGIGALSEALRLRPKISRVSTGSITPSSQRRADEKYGEPSWSYLRRIGSRIDCSSSLVN